MPARSYTLKDPNGPGAIVTPTFRTGQMVKDEEGKEVGRIIALGRVFVTVLNDETGKTRSYQPTALTPVPDLPQLPLDDK